MNKLQNEEKIDDLVAMIDQLMSEGGGHINVKSEGDDGEVEIEVETTKSTDCSKNGACSQPTELIDEEDD